MKTILVTAIGSFAADIVIKNLKKARCKVIGCDIYEKEWIAGAYNVDHFYQVPFVNDEQEYRQCIVGICKAHAIDFIFPLTDVEVDFYDKNRSVFLSLGVIPCISSARTIEICRNKMKLEKFLRGKNVCQTIPTYWLKDIVIEELEYPVVVKPHNGRSSQGLHYIATQEQMRHFVIQNKEVGYVVQPKIEGDIWTVDVIRNSNTMTNGCVVRKELLRTLNGAGTSVMVFRDEELENTCAGMAAALDINGCVNFEFIVNKDGEKYLIECNPRFSGGVAFSCLSGYDFVINHLKCFENKEIDLVINIQEQFIARKYEEFITRKL